MAWITWRNKRAYLRYRDATGCVKTKSLGVISKQEATAAKNSFELRKNRPAAAGVVFGVLVDKYLDWRKWEYPASNKRVRQMLNTYLVPVFGSTPIGALTLEAAEQYKIDRLKVAAPGTVQKEVRTLKAVLNKAIEWGMLNRNPLAALKAPKVLTSAAPPYYSIDELNRLYAACVAPDHAAMWRFLANTGLRRAELINLRQDDLRDNGIHVVSREHGRTKSGKWRLVPYTDGSKRAIDVLTSGRSDTFFVDRYHKDSISRACKVSLQRAGLPGSLHWLRHTFASHLVMQGVELRAVQQVMGHSTIAVTEQYAHLSDGFVDQRIGGLIL